jgi:hypothetical protein
MMVRRRATLIRYHLVERTGMPTKHEAMEIGLFRCFDSIVCLVVDHARSQCRGSVPACDWLVALPCPPVLAEPSGV